MDENCVFEDLEKDLQLFEVGGENIGFGTILPKLRWCWTHSKWE